MVQITPMILLLRTKPIKSLRHIQASSPQSLIRQLTTPIAHLLQPTLKNSSATVRYISSRTTRPTPSWVHRSSNCRPILQLAIFNQKSGTTRPLFFHSPPLHSTPYTLHLTPYTLIEYSQAIHLELLSRQSVPWLRLVGCSRCLDNLPIRHPTHPTMATLPNRMGYQSVPI